MLIGVDIEDISRFRDKDRVKDKLFLERIYTAKELDYCYKSKNYAKHLAARFCAKEAVFKALNSIEKSVVEFKNIEVLNSQSGSPYIVLHNCEKKFDISVSLSHDKEKAIAFVIANQI